MGFTDRSGGFFRKLALLFRRERFRDELSEEMAFHRAERQRELEADGLTAGQARKAAAREFGNAEHLKERSTEAIGFRFETVLQDLRFALRQLRRNPGFAVTATVILALGIAASVAIFAFVDAALIQPLPYRDPSRLVDVTEAIQSYDLRANLSYPDYLDWKRRNTVFSSLDVYNGNGFLMNTPDGPVPMSGVRVSDGFFKTLGVTPLLGRDFRAGEDLPGTADIVMLSYRGWQKVFGGRSDVIGTKVTLNGTPNTIIGVLPESFDFAPTGGAQFWAPFHAQEGCDLNRACHNLNGIARLKDGVTVPSALAQLQSIAAQLEREYPGSNRGQGAFVESLSEGIAGEYRPILLTLLAGAGLLLAIACINVASLLLVRSESRRREFALRGALGATRVRLVRQFLAEAVLLAGLGAVLGTGLADATMRLLRGLVPVSMAWRMPFLRMIGFNAHVLAFAAAITAAAVCLLVITPMLRLPDFSMREGLQDGSHGSGSRLWRRMGANLVIAELAVAVVLLCGAGLLGKSLYRLMHVETNFQTDHLAMIRVFLPKPLYPTDQSIIALQRQILSHARALPGVQSVGITTVAPLSYNGNTDWIRFVGRAYNGEHNEVNERDVSADFIPTLKARMLRGRLFTDDEGINGHKVVIINQKLADIYYPGQNPIGQRIGDDGLSPDSIKEVIGVVDNIKEGALDSEIMPAVYYPIYQSEDHLFVLLVRTSQAESSLLPALASMLHKLDPGLGTVDPSTMEDYMRNSPTAYLHQSSAWLVGGFAAVALLLGVVGLYGVIAYSVAQRTREIGVRMALGAQRGSVYALIMKEAGWLTGLGIALGLTAAVGAATLMRKLLFGTAAWDVETLASVAIVLAGAAMLASYLPARRAARVNPVEALRAD
jgi:predicted permease